MHVRFQRDPENAGGGRGTGEGGAGGDEGGDDGNGGDGEGSDDDEANDEEDKASKGKASREKTVPEAKYLQLRKHLSESDRKKQEALDELKALKTKDLPEAEKLTAERDEAVKDRDMYRGKYENMARTNAFLTASGDLKVGWKNATAALKLADLEDLVINDDGSVDGITDAVKALAKEHPYLVAEPEKDSDNDGKEKPGRKSGSPVGSKQGGKTNTTGKWSDEELKRLFPALY